MRKLVSFAVAACLVTTTSALAAQSSSPPIDQIMLYNAVTVRAYAKYCNGKLSPDMQNVIRIIIGESYSMLVKMTDEYFPLSLQDMEKKSGKDNGRKAYCAKLKSNLPPDLYDELGD